MLIHLNGNIALITGIMGTDETGIAVEKGKGKRTGRKIVTTTSPTLNTIGIEIIPGEVTVLNEKSTTGTGKKRQTGTVDTVLKKIERTAVIERANTVATGVMIAAKKETVSAAGNENVAVNLVGTKEMKQRLRVKDNSTGSEAIHLHSLKLH